MLDGSDRLPLDDASEAWKVYSYRILLAAALPAVLILIALAIMAAT